mgnify:CR=1 FL=1
MKIIKIRIVSSTLFNSLKVSLQADEHTDELPEGFESREQYEQAQDDNTSYKYIKALYGTHEVSISTMTKAVKKEGGLYIW